MFSNLKRGDQVAYVERMKGFLAGGGKLMDKSGRDAAELYRRKRLQIVLLAGLACVLAVGFGAWITRSITVPLQQAVRVARTVAGGDLGSGIEAGARGEVGQSMQALKEMNDGLRRIVGEVRSGTDAIAEQSSGLGQVNAAVLQMDAGTRQNAALVEQAAAAQALQDRAFQLAQLVSTFRLAKDAGARTPVVSLGQKNLAT